MPTFRRMLQYTGRCKSNSKTEHIGYNLLISFYWRLWYKLPAPRSCGMKPLPCRSCQKSFIQHTDCNLPQNRLHIYNFNALSIMQQNQNRYRPMLFPALHERNTLGDSQTFDCCGAPLSIKNFIGTLVIETRFEYVFLTYNPICRKLN